MLPGFRKLPTLVRLKVQQIGGVTETPAEPEAFEPADTPADVPSDDTPPVADPPSPDIEPPTHSG